MIQIIHKADCCGCRACEAICPVRCITMHEDEEGFLYPLADATICTGCGLCEKICPVLSRADARKPLKVYAAKNPDEQMRLASSSGGIFSLLAEKTISAGGVVFGVRFNDKWEAVHDSAETMEEIAAFRGSKYVQSDTGDTFVRVKALLQAGRQVLYTGVPCQIAGLRNFLRKLYPNLLLVDVVCHSVPSPAVWKRYLAEQFGENIREIRFRAKPQGWKAYHVCITGTNGAVLLDEAGRRNIYIQGFLQNLYLRPSCHKCPAKSFRSGSDLTIADYWGINRLYPDYDDDKGVGLVTVNTEKGAVAFAKLNVDSFETTYAEALRGNLALEQSAQPHKNREKLCRIGQLDRGTCCLMCRRSLYNIPNKA